MIPDAVSTIYYMIVAYIPIETIIVFLGILIAAYISNKILRRFLTHYFHTVSLRLKVSETKYASLLRLVTIAVWCFAFFALVCTVPYFNTLWVTVFASAGIIGIVIGLATQQTFSNIIAGIVVSLTEPFSIGDYITVGEFSGVLTDINLRDCQLRMNDGDMVIIPNSIIATSVIVKRALVT